MHLLIDSFWRAVAYCIHPRVMLLSLAPLLIMVAITSALGYFLWEPALDAIREALTASDLVHSAWLLLDNWGLGGLKAVLPLLVVLVGITPVVVVFSLLMVALFMAPAIVALIARRRFPELQRHGSASVWKSLGWSLGSVALALLAMVLTLPLWLIPPLFVLLPPLIWGWLNFRVMSYDALADHATTEERHLLLRKHGMSLWGMGVFTGYMGATPSLIWSFGMPAIVMAPFLIPLSIWIYTLVFAFSSLWYSHYCLAALHKLRNTDAVSHTAVVDVSVADSL